MITGRLRKSAASSLAIRSALFKTADWLRVRQARLELFQTRNRGTSTAVVRGKNNTTGVALVEAYSLPFTPVTPFPSSDVQTIINQAVTRAAAISPNSVIAVTDREGDVLGVWVMRGGDATDPEV